MTSSTEVDPVARVKGLARGRVCTGLVERGRHVGQAGTRLGGHDTNRLGQLLHRVPAAVGGARSQQQHLALASRHTANPVDREAEHPPEVLPAHA